MSINALIAGGITPVVTTSIADREAKRAMTDGQLRMNALNDDKLRENAYAIQQRNALNEGYAAENAQPGSGAARLAALGQASAIPAMNKTRTDNEAAQLTNKSTATKLYTDNMAVNYDKLRLVNSPEALEAWVEGMATDPVIGPRTPPENIAAFRAEIAAAKQDPARFAELMQRLRLTGKEYIAQTTQTFEQAEADKLQREQIASGDARAKGQLGLGYAQLAAQKEEAGARLDAARAKAGSALSPYDKKMQEAKAKQDVDRMSLISKADMSLDAVASALSVDPTTGTSVLDSATGSDAGAIFDRLARVVGASTTGAESIARLKSIESTLIQNGMKLSGSTSNFDAQLYQKAVGDIGNPNIPPAQKVEAMREVERQTKRAQDSIRASIGAPGKSPADLAASVGGNRKPLTDILGE